MSLEPARVERWSGRRPANEADRAKLPAQRLAQIEIRRAQVVQQRRRERAVAPRAVRGHVGQADDGRRHRRGDGQVQDDLGDAEDLDRVRERVRRVSRAGALIGSEVARQAVGRAAGAPRQ